MLGSIHAALELVGWREIWLALSVFALCVAMIVWARSVPRLAGRPADLKAVQSSHLKLTPRVGGLSVYVGLIMGLILVDPSHRVEFALLLLSSAPLFLSGLLEDLGYGVSAKGRLIAACLSVVLAMMIFGYWIPRSGFPGSQWIMESGLVGVPMTILVVAGVANGFNMIDGVNGLSSITAAISAISLTAIAVLSNVPLVAEVGVIMIACIVGFIAVNYPFGKMFLGDAGAYSLGFLVSWMGVILLNGNASLTPWAVLLTVFWPAADMLLAIYRRLVRKAATMAPDRLHIHQLVMRGIEIAVFGRRYRKLSNPLSTAILLPLVATPPTLAVLTWNNERLAAGALLVCTVFVVVSYFFSLSLIKKRRVRVGRASVLRIESLDDLGVSQN